MYRRHTLIHVSALIRLGGLRFAPEPVTRQRHVRLAAGTALTRLTVMTRMFHDARKFLEIFPEIRHYLVRNDF
jgi:hypothetical protein